MALRIARENPGAVNRDRSSEGEAINLVLASFLWVLIEKWWIANKRKRFCGEKWGNTVWGGSWKSREALHVGWSCGNFEYVWVNILCTLNWIVGFCHKTSEIYFLGIQLLNWWVHKKRRCYGWRGWTMWKFEPIVRLNIWWHNMLKRKFMYSRQSWKWNLARLWKNKSAGL